MWERGCPRWRCISQLMYRLTLSHRGIGIYTTLLSSAYWVCLHIRCCGHGHLGFRPYGGSLWRSAKVSKTLLPHHSVPRPGSACPQSGIAPWARRDRPSMAVSRLPRHPCRGAHCAIPACGQRGLTGRLRSKARSKAEQQQQQCQSRGVKLHSPLWELACRIAASLRWRPKEHIRVSGIHLSSLTTIAGKPAPTGVRARFDDQVGCEAASLCL